MDRMREAMQLGITYRADKNISASELISLYRAADYNQWWTERNVRAMLDHCYLIVTAWAGEQLVGAASALSDGVNYAHVDEVLVHPSFRGKGIGTRLMQDLLARIRPLNLYFVQLIPIPGRESFFEQLGFRVIPDHQVMELPR